MLERRRWSRPITPGSSGVEFDAEGVPTAIKIWGPGENESTKGSVFFTAKSAMLIMAAFKDRGMPLMWDYDHESTVPPEERKASASSGFGCASAHFSTIELRGADGAGEGFDQELWSSRIQWTDTARAQILKGDRRQVSPAFAVEKGTAEIVELYSMALCFEGATNRGRILSPLQMRLYSRGQRMDQIIEALRAAVEAGDWEQVKAALAALEQLTPSGTGDVAAVKAAVDEAVQAAFKKHARLQAPSGEIEAVRLAREAGESAKLEVRKERVAALIDRNPDMISKETETFLMSRGDVDTAKVIFAELGRSEKRQHGRSGADQPAGGGGAGGRGADVELTEAEKRQAAANGIAPEKMLASRERMKHGRVGTRQNGGR